MIRGGNGTGSIVSEPPGIACPPTCTAPFPASSQVTLVASPDAAAPFLSWKFGCTASSVDPRRCTLAATNRPNWVGVALGEDAEIGVPTTLSVLFDVARVGKGVITGRELDCGAKCEHRYVFGTREQLRARPSDGWRCHTVERSVQQGRDVLGLHRADHHAGRPVHGEPCAAVAEREGTGTKAARKVTVRLSVRHAARLGCSSAVTAPRRFSPTAGFDLRGGTNAVVLAVPAKVKAGRVRLTISVSDGSGGGRTYFRVVKVGP